MERTKHTVYKHRDIIYVPKYQAHDEYVGPGYGTNHFRVYTGQQLELLGAKKAKHPLVDPTIPLVRGKK